MVQRTIVRLAFPGGSPRPKPGPYTGEKIISSGEREFLSSAV
jgi:linoleoyl-CoA desaturase